MEKIVYLYILNNATNVLSCSNNKTIRDILNFFMRKKFSYNIQQDLKENIDKELNKLSFDIGLFYEILKRCKNYNLILKFIYKDIQRDIQNQKKDEEFFQNIEKIIKGVNKR